MQNIVFIPDDTIVKWKLEFLFKLFLSLLIFKYTAKGQHAEIIKLFAKF